MDLKKLKELFENNADNNKAEQMSAYMNKFPFFGIPKPKRAILTKEIFASDKNKEIDWQFVFSCFEEDEREFQYSPGRWPVRSYVRLPRADRGRRAL